MLVYRKLPDTEKEEIRAFVADKDKDNIGTRTIVEEIKERFSVALGKDQLYRIRQRILAEIGVLEEEVDETVLLEKKGKKAEVFIDNQGNHTINWNDSDVTFPISFVDTLFLYYSDRGYKYTEEEMRQAFAFSASDWMEFKRKFNLSKKSHVFSEWSAKNLPEEQLSAMIFRANQLHADKVRDRFVVTDLLREKKELAKLRKIVGNKDYGLDQIKQFLATYTPNIPKLNVALKPDNGRCQIIVSDIHWGNGNTKCIDYRWDLITKYAIEREENTIDLLVLGDLFESINPGGMHHGQAEHQDILGFELWAHVASKIEQMIVSLAKSGKRISFHGIGGNHDRLGRTHDEDQVRTAALMTYALVEARVNTIVNDFNYYKEKINKFEIGNTQFILHHGDDGFDKRRPENIAWNNGVSNDRPVIILHGDKHSGKFQEAKNITMIQSPALVGQGVYDKRLDLHSQPGFVVLKENEFGQIDTTFKRLPSNDQITIK